MGRFGPELDKIWQPNLVDHESSFSVNDGPTRPTQTQIVGMPQPESRRATPRSHLRRFSIPLNPRT